MPQRERSAKHGPLRPPPNFNPPAQTTASACDRRHGRQVHGWTTLTTIESEDGNDDNDSEDDVPLFNTLERNQTLARPSSSQHVNSLPEDHGQAQTAQHQPSPVPISTERSAAAEALMRLSSPHSVQSATAGPPAQTAPELPTTPPPISPTQTASFYIPFYPSTGPAQPTYRYPRESAKKRKATRSAPSSSDEGSSRADRQRVQKDVQVGDDKRKNRALRASKRRHRKANWLEELRKQLPQTDAPMLSENSTLEAASHYIAELKNQAKEARHRERRYIVLVERYARRSKSANSQVRESKAWIEQIVAKLS